MAQFNYQGPLMRNALINVPHVPPPVMPPSGLPPPQGPAATDFYPPFTSQFPAPSRPVSPHTQLLESMAGMQFEAGNLSQNGAPDDVQMQPSGSQPLVVTGPIPPPTQAEYTQAALESVNPDVIRIVRLVNSIFAPEEPPLVCLRTLHLQVRLVLTATTSRTNKRHTHGCEWTKRRRRFCSSITRLCWMT